MSHLAFATSISEVHLPSIAELVAKNHIESLVLNKEFNHPVNGLLCSSSIKSLSFANGGRRLCLLRSDFNQPLVDLPCNLSTLVLGSSFNCPIQGLPTSLKTLKIGNAFVHQLDHLPPNLEHLSIGSSFNSSINILPGTLTYLSLGLRFNQYINKLPVLLENLLFCKSGDFDKPIDELPPSLKVLKLHFHFLVM